MSMALVDLCYLISAVLFIIGLKGMTKPRTAVRGNWIGSLAMLLAVVATLLHRDVVSWTGILIAIAIGSVIGTVIAKRVQMTTMPQLVALFNGLGGGGSFLVAGAYLAGKEHMTIGMHAGTEGIDVVIATAASGLIGAVTLTGSLVAYGKLEEFKFMKDFDAPWQKLANLLLAVACIGLCAFMVVEPAWAEVSYWVMVLLALGLGVLLVISIGGADMPVVIALLNSYSGPRGIGDRICA